MYFAKKVADLKPRALQWYQADAADGVDARNLAGQWPLGWEWGCHSSMIDMHKILAKRLAARLMGPAELRNLSLITD